jgi:hypothetical protein
LSAATTALADATLGNYPTTSLSLSADTTVTPDAAPTNTTAISVFTSTNFKGKLEADPVTGVVRVTDAHPVGSYIVTVKAFATAGADATKTFSLNVGSPVSCGSFSFAAPVDYGVGNSPQATAVGDFNRDGKQDLAVANRASGTVSILLGTGSGTFLTATDFAVGNEPRGVAIDDFNGDGKQDLAVANSFSNSVSILLGDGTGGFSAATNFAAHGAPYEVAVGDFNGDGKQDLAVANGMGATDVSILLGDGLGGFSAPTNFGVGDQPSSIAIGDFNTDGKQDLVVANFNTADASMLVGDGTGGFTAGTGFSGSTFPMSIAVGDFNGDGKQDAVMANSGVDNVVVVLGDGLGGFAPSTFFSVGDAPQSVAVGDFNGDGKQDIATANTTAGTVSILLGDGTGGFAAAADFATSAGSWGLAVGDFNGDSKQDLAVPSSGTTNVSILLNTCTPFVNLSVSANTGTEAGTTAITVTATATGPVAGNQTVNLGVTGTNITAGDYTLTSSTITILSGNTAGSVTFTIVNDFVFEGTETATLTISSPSAGIVLGAVLTQNVAITDDEAPPSLAIDNVSHNEGNAGTTSYVFTVTKTGATEVDANVDYETQNGSATAPSDFSAISPVTLIFLPNETTKQVTVFVNGDTTYEMNEAFTVHLSTPVAATIGTADGTGTIVNDDVVPSFSIDNVSHNEGDAGTTSYVFTVTKTGATELNANVGFETQNGSATAPSDFSAIAPSTFIFLPNETTKQVTVLVNGDSTYEANEAFTVHLSTPVDASIGTADGTGTIVNDDIVPSFSIDNVSHNEGNAGTTSYVFTVTKTGGTELGAALDFQTQNVTAASPGDYQSTTGPLNFGAAETTKQVTVLVNGDTSVEPDETFRVHLLNPTNATIGTADGVGTITNDDAPALGNYPAASVPLSGNVTVTPDVPPPGPAGINVSTSTDFKGQLEGDLVSGVVRVTDAHPAGNYIVTVRAFEPGGLSTTKTFALTVTTTAVCPPILFAPSTTAAVGAEPFFLAVGDFNRDGSQDLVVANSASNGVSILLASGAASFAAVTNFSVGTNPVAVAVGDFNGDGKEDLAVANLDSNNVSILLGDGAGSFGPASNLVAGTNPVWVTVGDFNGDGRQDLAVANSNSATVSVFLGNGSGGFAAAANFAAGPAPSSVAVGDFNGDSKQDLVIANSITAGTVSVLLGDGTGGFSAATTFNVGNKPAAIVVGDFNGDSKQDLAVANEISANVSILSGNGTGGFGAPTNFSAGSGPRSLALGDFNGDGKPDLAVANQGSNSVTFLSGDGAGSFTSSSTTSAGAGSRSLAVGDFNGDGKQDLAVANLFSNNVSVLVRDCLPLPVITSPFIASPTVGQPFTYQFQTLLPATLGVTGLPPGLIFDPALSAIVGTPTAAGTVSATLNATNAAGTTSATLSLNIQPAPTVGPMIISSTAATGRTGQPFNFQVLTSGGSADARLSVAGLPPGFSFDPQTGQIFGTAAADSSTAVLLTITDGSQTTNATLQLTYVSDPTIPIIVSPNSAAVVPGKPFNYTIAAPSSADPSDTTIFGLVGTLPPGLTFNAQTGVISGTFTPNSGTSVEKINLSGGIVTNVQIFATNSHGTCTIQLSFFVPTGSVNISTRLSVGTGDNVLIGGFIITGNAPKRIIVRAISSSLKNVGVQGALDDPTLTLHDSNGILGFNDNWRDSQENEVIATTIPPSDDRESAIVATVSPGPYTAVVRGKNNLIGIALVEIYDLGTASIDTSSVAKLAQISTRGTVLTNDDVMIGGFIIEGQATQVLVRAIGPELTGFGVAGALQDTVLELRDGSGALLSMNDDWKGNQEQEIKNTGIPPGDPRESAILATVSPGPYTAIVRGKGNTTGIALVEVYSLQ